MKRFVVMLVIAGCGVRLGDPCADVAGTCLAIQIESVSTGRQVDALTVSLVGDGVTTQKTASDGKPLTLPVGIGVVFDSLPRSPVTLTVAIAALHQGQLVGYGSAPAVVNRGRHQSITVHVDGAETHDLAMAHDLGAPVDLASVADLVHGGRGHDLASGPSKLANGSRCSGGEQCSSSFCVDGYCCVNSCAETCQACDIKGSEGQCMAVTSGQPHGTRTRCLGLDAGVCAGECGMGSTDCIYPGPATACALQTCSGNTKYLASGCNQGGNCKPRMTVTCAQGCSGDNCLGACTGDAQCVAADTTKPFCDEKSGNCTAHKPQGRTCSAGSECTSTYCVDGYCCDGPCSAQCQTCKGVSNVASPGTCAVTVGAVVNMNMPTRTPCTVTESLCDGMCDGKSSDTTCQYHSSDTLCGSCCHGGSVDKCDGAGHCVTSPCASETCAVGSGCGDCSATRSCSTNAQCKSGNCLGSVCCSAPSCPSLANELCQPATGACDCASDCGDGSRSTCGDDDGCGNTCNVCISPNAGVCCTNICCQTTCGQNNIGCGQ
jgi:hypothetical protein